MKWHVILVDDDGNIVNIYEADSVFSACNFVNITVTLIGSGEYRIIDGITLSTSDWVDKVISFEDYKKMKSYNE